MRDLWIRALLSTSSPFIVAKKLIAAFLSWVASGGLSGVTVTRP
jgi:hypothetical protein